MLLLAGCSSGRQFFYNRLPMLLPWYLDRYVDLDAAQAERFDTQVERLLSWHRREELPRYLDLLNAIEARLDAPVDAQGVAAVSADLELAWYRIRDRALDELLLLGATLSEAQVEEFLAHLDKRQRKYREKYLDRSDQEYREDAADSLRDNLEDYLGRLRPPQRDIIDSAVQQLARSDSAWIAERQRWIDMLRRELEREPGWEQRIRVAVRDWETTLDAETAAIYEGNTAVVEAAIAAVVSQRSDDQDARLRRELASLREDLAALAAQS